MEVAAEHARKGDLGYFVEGKGSAQLPQLVKRRDEDGRSLLHSAAASGNLQLAQLIADAGGPDLLTVTDDEGWGPLHSAASAGHEAVVEYLLKLGAEVDAVTSGQRTPLHYAASKGWVGVVRLLLQHGAGVNKQDSTGSTPLHRAASAGKSEAVRVLVEEGKARIDARDTQGSTPLLVAVVCDQGNIALYLASKGADVEAVNKEDENPLGMASAKLREALLATVRAHEGGGELDEA